MATIADISSGHFIYNTFDYRDSTKVGPAAWTTVYLLNLKPTDYILQSNYLRNNINIISNTAQGLSVTPVSIADVNNNLNGFLNKIQPILTNFQFLFRVKSKNGWLNLQGTPNMDISERVDEIDIMALPPRLDPRDRPKIGTYEDYTLTPSRVHDVYRWLDAAWGSAGVPTSIMTFKKKVDESQNIKITKFRQIDSAGNFIADGPSILIEQKQKNAFVKISWESATGQQYECIMHRDTVNFQVDPHTGIITTWVTVTTGQTTLIGEAATTASLTEIITNKVYDISEAVVVLEEEEQKLKAELKELKAKVSRISVDSDQSKKDMDKLKKADQDFQTKDKQLEQKIDAKVDKDWIDDRMLDISAIEILDAQQQTQIDKLIAEDISGDKIDTAQDIKLTDLRADLTHEVSQRKDLSQNLINLATETSRINNYAIQTRTGVTEFISLATDYSNNTTRHISDISGDIKTVKNTTAQSFRQIDSIVGNNTSVINRNNKDINTKVDDISRNNAFLRNRLDGKITKINTDLVKEFDDEITLRTSEIGRVDRLILNLTTVTSDYSNNTTRHISDISGDIKTIKQTNTDNLNLLNTSIGSTNSNLKTTDDRSKNNRNNITLINQTRDSDFTYFDVSLNNIRTDISENTRLITGVENSQANVLATQIRRVENIIDVSFGTLESMIIKEVNQRTDLSQNNIDTQGEVDALETVVSGNNRTLTGRIINNHQYTVDLSSSIWINTKRLERERKSKDTSIDVEILDLKRKDIELFKIHKIQDASFNRIDTSLGVLDLSMVQIYNDFETNLKDTTLSQEIALVNSIINNNLKPNIATNYAGYTTNRRNFDTSFNAPLENGGVFTYRLDLSKNIAQNLTRITNVNSKADGINLRVTNTNTALTTLETDKVDKLQLATDANTTSITNHNNRITTQENKTSNLKKDTIKMMGTSWTTGNYSELKYVTFKNDLTHFETGFTMDGIRSGTSRDHEILIRNEGIYVSKLTSGDISLNRTGRFTIYPNTISNAHIKTTDKIDIAKTTLGIDLTKFQWDNDTIKLKEDYLLTTGLQTLTGNLKIIGDFSGASPDPNNFLRLHSENATKFSIFSIGTNESNCWHMYYGLNKNLQFWHKEETLTGDNFLDRVSMSITHAEGYVAIGAPEDNKWTPPADERLHVHGNIKVGGDILIPNSLNGLKFSSNTSGKILIGNGTRYIPKLLSGAISIDDVGFTSLNNNIINNTNADNVITDNVIDVSKVKITFGSGLSWNNSTNVLTAQGETVINDGSITSAKLQNGIPMSKTNFQVQTEKMTFNGTSGLLEIKDTYYVRKGPGAGTQRIYDQISLEPEVARNTNIYINSKNKEAGIIFDQENNGWQIYKRSGTQYLGFYKYGSYAGAKAFFDNTGSFGIGYEPGNPGSLATISEKLPAVQRGIESNYKLLVNGNTMINGDLVFTDAALGIKMFNVNTSGNMLVADGDRFLSKTMTGDATLSSTGQLIIGTEKISNSNINNSANIQVSKLALTTDHTLSIDTNTLKINPDKVISADVDGGANPSDFVVGRASTTRGLLIKRGDIWFGSQDGTATSQGGNRHWRIAHNYAPDPTTDMTLETFGIYPVIGSKTAVNSTKYDRGVTIDFNSGKLTIRGGLELAPRSNSWSNKSVLSFVEFKDKYVYFKNGFYVGDKTETPSDLSKEGDILIRSQNLFKPYKLTGDASLSNNGRITISAEAVNAAKIKNNSITNTEISDSAAIDIRKTNLKLGSGLAWKTGTTDTIINTGGTTAGLTASKLDSSALDSNYFQINSDKLTIKSGTFFLKNSTTDQSIQGNVTMNPINNNGYIEMNLFTNQTSGSSGAYLNLGTNANEYISFYKNDQTLDYGLYHYRTLASGQTQNKFIFTIHPDNGNMAIGISKNSGELPKTFHKLHVGGSIKADDDLYLNKQFTEGGITKNRGIICNNNDTGKIFVADGNRFKPVSITGDIDITSVSESNCTMKINNGKITNTQIATGANILISKTALTVDDNLELNVNTIKVKANRFIRDPIQYDSTWNFNGTSASRKGSLTITPPVGFNNVVEVFNNSTSKYSGLRIGRTTANHWEMYQQTNRKNFVIYRSDKGVGLFINGTTLNVGIGISSTADVITNTTEKLTVNGNIKIIGNNDLIIEQANHGIKTTNNTAGRVLIANGTRFISQAVGGAITINSTGNTSYVNQSISNDAISNNAQITLSKINLNVDGTSGLQIVGGDTIKVKDDWYIRGNASDTKTGSLTIKNNGEVLRIQSTKSYLSGSPPNYGCYISFFRTTANSRGAYMGFTGVDAFKEFSFVNESANGYFVFNKNVKVTGDIEVAGADTGLKMNDNTNKKMLMAEGNKYKPANIWDCLNLGSNLSWDAQNRLQSNSSTGVTNTDFQNLTGTNISIKPSSGSHALTILSKNSNTDSSNDGCKIAFKKDKDDSGIHAEIGFGQQKPNRSSPQQNTFRFKNEATDGTFRFNRDLHLIDDSTPTQAFGSANIRLGCDNHHPLDRHKTSGIIWQPHYTGYENKISAGIKFIPEGRGYFCGGLGFYTNNDKTNDTGLKERMRLDTSGNLLINRTDTTNYPLHIGTKGKQNNGTALTTYNNSVNRLGIQTSNHSGSWCWSARDPNDTMAGLDLTYGETLGNKTYGVTYHAGGELFRMGVNNKYPRETFSVSTIPKSPWNLNNSTKMSIIAPGENSDAILYLGTPFRNSASATSQNRNALKSAIIAEGINSFGKSKLLFCLNNADNNSNTNDADKDDARMIITADGNVGIGNFTSRNPQHTLHVHERDPTVMNSEPLALFQTTAAGHDCSIRIEGKGGESYLEIANTSALGSTTKSWGIGMNDNKKLAFNWKDNGGMNTLVSSVLTLNGEDNRVGINNTSPTQALEINGSCKANSFIGDGSLLTGIQNNGSIALLHNYHRGTDINFQCKFLCNGSFASTQQHPLKSKTTILMEETEATGVTDATKFPSLDGVVVYHARPNISKDKALKISGFNTGSNYFGKWTISFDIRLNDNIPSEATDAGVNWPDGYGNAGWLALLNLVNTDDAELYLKDGAPWMRGMSKFTGTKKLDLDTWYSVCWTFDTVAGEHKFYVKEYTSSNIHGAWALWGTQSFTNNSVKTRMRLYNDMRINNEALSSGGDTWSNNYTGDFYIKNITVVNKYLDSEDKVSDYIDLGHSDNRYDHFHRMNNGNTSSNNEKRINQLEKQVENLMKINKELVELIKK